MDYLWFLLLIIPAVIVFLAIVAGGGGGAILKMKMNPNGTPSVEVRQTA